MKTFITKSFFRIITLGFFSSTLCLFVFAEDHNGTPAAMAAPVILEIDGAKITFADLERKHPAGLFQARNNFYQAERKAVEEFIDDYLLEQQAQKEKVTVAQLLERHVTGKIPGDPPEEAIRVYYEGVDTTEPYATVRGQILDHIRENRLIKAKAAYMQSLHSQAHMTLRFGPPRAEVALKDTPIRGVSDAPVMIVEYADYECAYCQQTQPALEKILTEFQGKVGFAYKDVPLPAHTHAQKAAEAAHCADAQGKYWEYHDLLFKTKELEVPKLKEDAGALKLDTTLFNKCLDSGEKAAGVKAELAEAQGLGLQGTPSFFVNGRFFSGGLSYEQLHAVIQEELNAAARPKETGKQAAALGRSSEPGR